MRRSYRRLFLFTVFLSIAELAAVDNAHFYKAPLLHRMSTTCWFEESRKYEVSDWLTKFDFTYAYGDSGTAWNQDGDTTLLLNITGNHNMLYLMENVSQIDPMYQHFANFFANAQINHWATNNNFGQLEFDGKFRINDFNINWRQNLVSGFFFELLVPIRDVTIKDIRYIDLSPETGRFSKQTGEWRQFLNQFDVILANYDYKPYATSYSATDLGDISFNIGWEGIKEYKEEESLEFLGFMLKTGVLFPSGKTDDVDYCFSVPTGYNDHWGINFNAQLDMGINSWLSVAVHASATVFFDESEVWRRMKTFSKQNGFIKLEKGKAEEEKGSIWHIGADIKFDHVGIGLSLLVGYSFNKQENDTLNPVDKDRFDHVVVNSDSVLAGWEMHVLHFMADYDFSVHMNKKGKWAPRINIFYNWLFEGEGVFKTDMFGGGLGIDLRWKI